MLWSHHSTEGQNLIRLRDGTQKYPEQTNSRNCQMCLLELGLHRKLMVRAGEFSAGAFDPGSSDVSFMLADLYFQWCNHKIVPFLCNWFNRLSVHILRVQHELFDTLDKGGWIETLFCTFVPMTMELFCCCFFILLWPTTHCVTPDVWDEFILFWLTCIRWVCLCPGKTTSQKYSFQFLIILFGGLMRGLFNVSSPVELTETLNYSNIFVN